MGILSGIPLVGSIAKKIIGVVDKAVKDKDQAEKLKAEIKKELLSLEVKEIEAKARIVVAEAQGGSWWQRNWRPLTMMMFAFIIFNNFILFPYLSLFTEKAIELPTPEDLWTVIKIGLGGYVVGRSAEKVTAIWKKS